MTISETIIKRMIQVCESNLGDTGKQLAENIRTIAAERDRLKEASEVYEKMCVCYRTGRRPSESLLDRLTKVGEAAEAARDSKEL
jgi:hypothetical protein